MILNALIERLKRRSKGDCKGRHCEASLILQAVSWYLRYPLSYRDIEEMLRERGLEVDHSTLNRWVPAYALLIERRLRAFRQPHCGSIRVDETYIKVRGEWRYLYRAIDKHGTPVDFLLTARRDLEAAKRFFRKMLQEQPLLSPDRIGTDAAGPYPRAIRDARKAGLLEPGPKFPKRGSEGLRTAVSAGSNGPSSPSAWLWKDPRTAQPQAPTGFRDGHLEVMISNDRHRFPQPEDLQQFICCDAAWES